MKVTIDMTKNEINEYLNIGYEIEEHEYIETIKSDIKFILEKEGFQEIKPEDITVNTHD
ncbi:hypothetical protein M5U04_20110 [Xenorhabdus sp. XENO-1]|uniref:hypothetical protein n=1 Tax=Xenorhabdus bovienii TaxID=40576 RepID=UPI0020CA6B3A|nr:hypothetical protein [Xenorhabdus bovienii]MCP9270313.1 hypothetical protein [Xenorhabdus bovienii subsp. africana]